jgi:hypothetical protein
MTPQDRSGYIKFGLVILVSGFLWAVIDRYSSYHWALG